MIKQYLQLWRYLAPMHRLGAVARDRDGNWTWGVTDDVVREALKQFSV